MMTTECLTSVNLKAALKRERKVATNSQRQT